MGLTNKSTGSNAANEKILKKQDGEKVVALAGNPNVGKSTVFNELTGMNQHTGNWPGKTVANAQGRYRYNNSEYILVDLPGTYSLMSSSVEEEIARDYICFGESDAVIIVCDATCLERNLNLVLQVLEITTNAIVCVNLLDEAKKKKIHIDLDELSLQLGVPVVGTSARSGKGLGELMSITEKVSSREIKTYRVKNEYPAPIEEAIQILSPEIENAVGTLIDSRWVAIRLLDFNERLNFALSQNLNLDIRKSTAIAAALDKATSLLEENAVSHEILADILVSTIVGRSEEIASKCVRFDNKSYTERDRKIDKILTSRLTGIPIMLLMLGGIFWLTITGSNYPSQLLSNFFSIMGLKLSDLINSSNLPAWVEGFFIQGIFKTVTWVISVMLPPMAIFFPLFTLLEDSGFLPRIAFNLDRYFRKANAHGKQSLTMCMGFGCNACGVMGCRIIDSPRERLIAILTNNFVPCNGRFPTLIAIITMFFAGISTGLLSSVFSTLILVGVILLGIFATLAASKFLSKTLLKGIPSSFALELPPYRSPQIGKVIVRSIFDRTLFVLGRAVCVAIPAGAIIWLMANILIGNLSILSHCSQFLDPFGAFIGLDGVIILAFILGFPANEIVMPIIIMAYSAQSSLADFENLGTLKTLLISNGWTWVTAVCVLIFVLFHFPCSTTCLTIKKETKSIKWTAIAIILPTVTGILACAFVANVARIFR